MTRTEAKRKARRRRKRQQAAAWAVVILLELAAAVIPTALVGAILIPTAYAYRGGPAFGGEWLAVAITFCVAYGVIHNRVCDTLFDERRKPDEVQHLPGLRRTS